MKTETGKLMSSGRVGFSGRRTEVDSYYPVTHEDWIVLRDRIEQLEGVVGNLTRQYASLLTIWLARHPSEAYQELKAHPDNLANHLEPDHGRSGC